MWLLCDIIGTGVSDGETNDPFRPAVADYPGGWSVTVMLEARGRCIVRATWQAAFDSDPRIRRLTKALVAQYVPDDGEDDGEESAPLALKVVRRALLEKLLGADDFGDFDSLTVGDIPAARRGRLVAKLDAAGLSRQGITNATLIADALRLLLPQIHARVEPKQAAPGGTFTDTFNGAGSTTNLEDWTPTGGTAWTRVDGSAGAAAVHTDGILKSVTAGALYQCDDQGSANHYVEVTFATTAARNARFANRATNINNLIGYVAGATTTSLVKVDAGSVTELASGTSNPGVGSVLRLESSGNAHEGFFNGVSEFGPVNDSFNATETRQGVGIQEGGSNNLITSFEAGTLGGGTPTASGALTAQAADVAGTASRTVKATGALLAGTADVSGLSAREVKTISAAVAAQLAAIVGAASRTAKAQGAPAASAASVDGSASGGSVYQPQAVEFDGTNDWGARGADLTGNADSKLVTFAFWAKVEPTANLAHAFTAEGSRFALRWVGSSGLFQVVGLDAAGSNVINGGSSITGLDDGAWHHYCGSFDVGNNLARLYIDDVSRWSGTLTDAAIDFTRTDYFFGASSGTGSNSEQFCVADFWCLPGTYIDLSVTANRRKFIGAGAARSVDLGTTGELPTGSSPLVYFSKRGSDTDDAFLTNKGTGGGFTVTGALTACATNPPQASGATASGALAAGAAAADGSATRTAKVSGALAAQAADVAGVAVRIVKAVGTLLAQAATVTGIASNISASGTLQAGDSTVAGTGSKSAKATGALSSGDATVAGVVSRAIKAAGTLAAQAVTISGLASVFTFFWRETDAAASGSWTEESASSGEWTEESAATDTWTEEDPPA